MNTLERHVLETIGENPDNPDVFLDTPTGMAPIRDSINDAIEEVSMLTGSNKVGCLLPLLSNRNFYRLKVSRLAWITNAWLYGTRRRLEQKDFIWLITNNPRWLYNTGTPEVYAQVGFDTICIWPASASDTSMIEFECVTVPDRYTSDSERIMLRDNYMWAAVHFAVSEYWAGRGDAKTANIHLQDYLRIMGLSNLYPETQEKIWQLRTTKQDQPTTALYGKP